MGTSNDGTTTTTAAADFTSTDATSGHSTRYSKCVEKYLKSSLFRIKPTSTSATTAIKSSSTSLSSILSSSSTTKLKEYWLDASTLGICNNCTNNGNSNPTSTTTSTSTTIFSDLYSRYLDSSSLASASNNDGSSSSCISTMMITSAQGATGASKSNNNDSTTTTTTVSSPSFIKMFQGQTTDFSSSLTSSWSSKLERIVSDYLVAVTVGCVLGAAVATGTTIGVITASSMLRFTNTYIPTLYRWFDNYSMFPKKSSSEKRRQMSPDDDDDNDTIHENGKHHHNEPKDNETSTTSVVTIYGDDSLILLKTTTAGRRARKGSTTTLSTIINETKKGYYYSPQECCKTCLDELSILLSKNGASWKTVKQITAYLVSTTASSESESLLLPTTIEPQQFRTVLKGYLDTDSTTNKDNDNNNSPIISIRFVQRLENEYNTIEIEAVATTTKTTKQRQV